ncbi:MAG: hypothetical protein ACREL4_08835 [Gemmatimonadales bacterium]
MPVDEARRDPSLTAFRAQLVRAVETRDTTFVLSVLAPNILNSFGGDGGVGEFRHHWQLAAGGARLWTTLHDILTHGGSFLNDSLFEAPYWSAGWRGAFDIADHAVVIDRHLRVRAGPRPEAASMGTLSYDIVQTPGALALSDTGWTAIQLKDGRTGYVPSRYLRSPDGYRLDLAKHGGRWYVSSLVAGD